MVKQNEMKKISFFFFSFCVYKRSQNVVFFSMAFLLVSIKIYRKIVMVIYFFFRLFFESLRLYFFFTFVAQKNRKVFISYCFRFCRFKVFFVPKMCFIYERNEKKTVSKGEKFINEIIMK